MISDPKYNFVFVEIPKTAGSSMRARLFRMGCADVNDQKYDLIVYPYAQHYNIQEYRHILGGELDSRFKFAFVRNPWGRLVSSFTRECSNWRNSTMPRDWILNPKRFQEWVPTALKPGRRATNRRHPHHLGKSNRVIAESQLNFITDKCGNVAVDFVGRFENAASDFEKILTKLNSVCPLPPRKYWVMPRLNVSHGADEHYSFYYDDGTIEKVRTAYQKDIEYFGYEYETHG